MAILVQVTVFDDSTGEVERAFVKTYEGSSYSFAQDVRQLLSRVMVSVFGNDDAL